MGRHLNRAISISGPTPGGMLEGGHYALLHTRSLEFDDLRPYVPGDEIRDIDWRASARAGDVLVKRFVTEKHHKILLVCDAGRNMSALTPSGEIKRDMAHHRHRVPSDSSGCGAPTKSAWSTAMPAAAPTCTAAAAKTTSKACSSSSTPTPRRRGLQRHRHPTRIRCPQPPRRLLLIVVSDEPDTTSASRRGIRRAPAATNCCGWRWPTCPRSAPNTARRKPTTWRRDGSWPTAPHGIPGTRRLPQSRTPSRRRTRRVLPHPRSAVRPHRRQR